MSDNNIIIRNSELIKENLKMVKRNYDSIKELSSLVEKYKILFLKQTELIEKLKKELEEKTERRITTISGSYIKLENGEEYYYDYFINEWKDKNGVILSISSIYLPDSKEDMGSNIIIID